MTTICPALFSTSENSSPSIQRSIYSMDGVASLIQLGTRLATGLALSLVIQRFSIYGMSGGKKGTLFSQKYSGRSASPIESVAFARTFIGRWITNTGCEFCERAEEWGG